ncbi:discoidin domain-containing protein [Akkermansiaceae bacterium]|nr:discoidin domain-containing protein [Akkermansiaceae bacterium]
MIHHFTQLMLRTALFVALFLWTPVLNATTYSVSNASDFNALPTLNAGDIVVLASGNYGALDKTLVSSISNDATAQSNPIFVTAASAGGVNVTAPSLITLQGRGIILAGLDFVSGSGMKDNGSSSPASLIKTAANSRYMTISNIRYLDCTAGDDYGHWLNVEGFHHTIEYCSFEGKDEPVANSTVAFKRNTSEAGISMPRDHVMRRCYFGPRECSTSENGYESIRIGDSSSQAHDMRVIIEENVFYHAIWRADGEKPNDMEIISNKTKGNIIRNNTFLESYGQITLRHGDACVVEGNYIIGGGYYSGSSILRNSANPYQSGIRVIGQDHIIRNNYLENLIGNNLRAALSVLGGESGWDDGNGSGGDNGYEAADSAEVYHNTFIDCKELHLGYLNRGTIQPVGVLVYNNAWQGRGSSNGIERESGFSLGGSGGNYIYHPSGDYGWTGLSGTYSASTSPDVTDSFDDYNIPTTSSPLLNAADLTLSSSTDVRQLTRPTTGRDIGSFEREVSGSGMRPLLRDEIGPEFDGGPSGTYPVPGDTKPTITTSSLPNGAIGVSYQEALSAGAGDSPLTWSISAGSLPVGVSMNSSGFISGTPTTSGTSNFTVIVSDVDSDSDTQALSLIIDAEPGPDPAKFSLSGGDVIASMSQSPNIAGNTLDGALGTRWSAQGDGEWIRYDLGSVMNIHFLKLAWLDGASRTANFDVEVSDDDTNWTAVLSDEDSSGTTTALETVEIPDTPARYVRIVGHGNSSPSLWNSITETEIWGTAVVALPPEAPVIHTVNSLDGRVVVLWDASPGATSYKVKRSTVSGSGYVTVTNLSGVSYLDTGVVNGTTYHYVISAVSVAGESTDSSEERGKPFAPIGPEELGALTLSLSGENIQATVMSVAGRVYQMQRSEDLTPGSWVNVGATVIGTGASMILEDSDTPLPAHRFYRLVIQP